MPTIFNRDTIDEDGSLILARVYSTLYSEYFVEDSRPDYFIKKSEFYSILKKVYNTECKPIYESFLSGKCFSIILVPEFKTMFAVTFLIETELVDRYRISSKDLEFAQELSSIDDIQNNLDQCTPEEYKKRELSPFISEEELTHAIVRVFYYPISEKQKAVEFCEEYNKLKFERNSLKTPSNDAIYTLGQDSKGLILNKHYLDTDKYKSDIIESNYNDDFAIAYKKIVSFLKSKSNGLVLLTGEPGTGKSSLLMHLTSVCKDLNTRFVFIPAVFADILSDPSFLSFAISNLDNSVLVLEDAEEVLKARSAGGSSSVSNILNITDGILGKLVKVKIIATVNKSHVIDTAITRKGRLRLYYTFTKLSVEKSNKLYKKLKKSNVTTVPLTLAEIYNSEPIDLGITEPKKIGF